MSLFNLIFGLILLMPVLGCLFIGLALRLPHRQTRWLLLMGLLIFVLSFVALQLKVDAIFYGFFLLGPTLFGIGLPGNPSRGRRIQAGVSGLGLLLVFWLFLYLFAQILNHV